MLPHVMIVDDEEHVLDALAPGFVAELARKLQADPAVRAASRDAGHVLPDKGRLDIHVSAEGFRCAKLEKLPQRRPAHLKLHLVCEQGGDFPLALRLLREQFVAVVVSDLRFSGDARGVRAGKFFIEDLARRHPAAFGVLYSAYQRPDGFPAERFVRKGASSNLGGEELAAKIAEGVAAYLRRPEIALFARECRRRGLGYQSDAFGAVLKRLHDAGEFHLGPEPAAPAGRRRPRPTLLLDGETGTGKTELAALLHDTCARRGQPFQIASCNQLTNETFLRSALFGHVKGAFSGAAADRPGLALAAGRGTLLLDDLHAITPECAVALHSFLDDGEYSHLGQDETRRHAAAAIIATVETPRWEEIKRDRLLPESFVNRAEQLALRVPPLRERPEDIAAQAAAYCAEQAAAVGAAADLELSPAALDWLTDFGFPNGNSRKLRDFVKGLVGAFGRSMDYLDVREVEEYAAESGLLGIRRAAPPKPNPPKPVAPLPVTATAAWPPSDVDPQAWPARIARLAASAIAEEAQLPEAEAEAACRRLFQERFPALWAELKALAAAIKPGLPLDIKLCDELLRFFAVYQAGSPARAAKELGMKDNALREFIYSREARRGKA